MGLKALFLVAMGMACALAASPAQSLELLMLEQKGCAWCARWHKEIGAIYPKTDEGKMAPLRSIDIHSPIPKDLAAITIERFTPTFVLVDAGVELGRIRGYPVEEFFWFLLQEILDKADMRDKEQ